MDRLQRLLERFAPLLLDQRSLVARHAAALHELLEIETLDRLLLSDLAVEPGLRERGLVALVVAVLAVADEIDHDVVAEALAIGHRELRHVDDGLRVVSVHVKDRHLDHLRDVGAVESRARLGGRRRVADLVVDDHVDRAAGAVARELREIERLGDDPLPGERRVAVDDHGDDGLAVSVGGAHLLGLRAALDDRVDGLEVGRIRGEREMDALTALRPSVGREALVVLHVARTEGRVHVRGVLELREDRLVALAEGVREDVQATAMGHPENDLADAEGRRILDDVVEERDQRLAPFEGEALLPEEFRVEKLLEELRRGELLEDAAALAVVEVRLVLSFLHDLAQPRLAAGILDVGELDADRTAVGLAEARQDLTQGLDGAAREVARDVRLVEVLVPEAVVRRVELREVGRLTAEGIALRDAMAAGAIGMNHAQDTRVLVGDVQQRRVVSRAGGRGGRADERTEHTAVHRFGRIGGIGRRLARRRQRDGTPGAHRLGRGLLSRCSSKLFADGARIDDAPELDAPTLVDGALVDPVLVLDLLDPAGVDPEALEVLRVGGLGFVPVRVLCGIGARCVRIVIRHRGLCDRRAPGGGSKRGGRRDHTSVRRFGGSSQPRGALPTSAHAGRRRPRRRILAACRSVRPSPNVSTPGIPAWLPTIWSVAAWSIASRVAIAWCSGSPRSRPISATAPTRLATLTRDRPRATA